MFDFECCLHYYNGVLWLWLLFTGWVVHRGPEWIYSYMGFKNRQKWTLGMYLILPTCKKGRIKSSYKVCLIVKSYNDSAQGAILQRFVRFCQHQTSVYHIYHV